MQNSTLIRLLKNLDKKSFRALGDFVCSPFFNKEKSVLHLFEYIKSAHPDFEEAKLERSKALNKLYPPDTPKQRLNDDMSKLSKLCRKFLAHNQLEESPLLEKRLLLDAYRRRGMTEELSEGTEKFVQQLREEPRTDTLPLRLGMEAQFEAFFYPATEKYTPFAPYLYGALHDLEQYYQLHKARIVAEILHRRHIYQEEEVPAPAAPAVLDMYRRLLAILESPTPHSGFEPLLDDIERHFAALADFDQRMLLDRLYHVANRRYEKGHSEYVPILFRIIKIADQYEVLTYQDAITPVALVNYAAVAGMAGDLEWGRQFVTRYQSQLTPEHREAAIHLAEAHLLFYEGQFSQCLRRIGEAERYHAGMRIHAETLYLRTYCELERQKGESYLEEFQRCQKRFSKFLHNDARINKEKIKALRRLILLTSCLMQYYNTRNEKQRQKLHQQRIHKYFHGADKVYSAFWLQKYIRAFVPAP
jgi:hypothetical protein